MSYQLQPITKPDSITQKVYQVLLESIMTLSLVPGQFISENTLAEQLHVSRTPVREALKRLEQEDLVRTSPQSGSQVLKLSRTQLEEAGQLRAVLETWAAETAAHTIDPGKLEEMLSIQKSLHEAFTKKDFVRWMKLDATFHEVFLEAAGNRKVIQTVRLMNFQIYRLRLLWLNTGKDVGRVLTDHHQLIDGLKRKDLALIETVLERHLGFGEIISEMHQAWPQYFE